MRIEASVLEEKLKEENKVITDIPHLELYVYPVFKPSLVS